MLWTHVDNLFKFFPIHADIIHFGGNMLMLAVVGLAGENKIGSIKFVLFYFFFCELSLDDKCFF
jgi:membrane associated rhomboid family serine protease